jgi:hypothetical protein
VSRDEEAPGREFRQSAREDAMRRSTAASFVVVAFALFAASGCGKSEGAGTVTSADKPAAGPDVPPPEKKIGPPGISQGVVQISKIVGGVSTPIGVVASFNHSELWVLMQGMTYPVELETGEALRFDFVGPADNIDTNQDNKIDKAELCATPFGAPWITGNATRVEESSAPE